MRINIFPLNEIVQQTNENLQKIISTSPIISEKCSSINRRKENLPVLVDDNEQKIYDSIMMPIKVKDFENYVRNAIKLGLLDQQYEVFLITYIYVSKTIKRIRKKYGKKA